MPPTGAALVMRPPWRRRAGFTLLEVTLVIGMLLALLALAWPEFQGQLDLARLTGAADQLRGALRQARRDAMATQRVHRFEFEPATRRYRVVAEPASGADAEEIDVHRMALDADAAGATADGIGDSGELPPGVRLRLPADEPSSFDAGSRTDGVSPPLGTMTSLDEPTADASRDEAVLTSAVAAERWIPLFHFFPDGTSTDGTVVVEDGKRRSIVITLDGLSGTVEIGNGAEAFEAGWGDALSPIDGDKGNVTRSEAAP